MKSPSGQFSFFARDPGAAAALVPVIRSLKSDVGEGNQGGSSIIVGAKDFALPIFKNAGFEPQNIDSIEAAKNLLGQTKVLLTGTGTDFEIAPFLWRESKRRGIPCGAYMDHWMAFDRFRDESGHPCFPEHVLLTDEICSEAFVEVNGTVADLYCVGNPGLEAVLAVETSMEEMRQFRAKHGVAEAESVFVFAAEVIEGTDFSERYGSDEFQQFEHLYQSLIQIGKPCTLVFRPHPKHDQNRCQDRVSRLKSDCVKVVLDSDSSKVVVLDIADVVFGLNTIVLVESLLRGRRSCSLAIDVRSHSTFELIRQNYIYRATSGRKIIDFINGNIKSKPYNGTLEGSTKRLINVLKRLR